MPRDHRDAFCSPAETAVLTEPSRHFDREGILLPKGTCGSPSTPMGIAEIDMIAQVYDRFLKTRSDLYAGL